MREVDIKEGWNGWMTVVFAAGSASLLNFLTWSLSTGVESDRLIVVNSSFVFISDLYVAAHQADDYLRSCSSIKVGFAAASHTQT